MNPKCPNCDSKFDGELIDDMSYYYCPDCNLAFNIGKYAKKFTSKLGFRTPKLRSLEIKNGY